MLSNYIDYLKILPLFFLPKRALTCFAGFLANVHMPIIKNYLIGWFIRKYKVNMAEAIEENYTKYISFNDFFIRRLKPECRLLATAELISPVDGYVSEIGNITDGKMLQAKGRLYSVNELLACDHKTSEAFKCFATFYLSPKDYHRVHLPIDATLTSIRFVPGKLFAVKPSAVKVMPSLFARNERVIMFFNTKIGEMAIVLVGATIVGTIGTRWHGDLKRQVTEKIFMARDLVNLNVSQGEEIGYFKLGSTVITLFTSPIRWQRHLIPGQPILYGSALSNIG